MRFLDTNVFVRALTLDDLERSEASRRLLLLIDEEQEEATTSESVIAEVVYVLSSRAQGYGLPRQEIIALLQPLLRSRGLRLPDRNVYLRALDVYGLYNIDFEDALSVAHMERAGVSEIVSYDRDFDRIPEVTRTEP